MSVQRKHITRLLAILPIIIAVIVVAYMLINRVGPTKMPPGKSVKALHVIMAPSCELIPEKEVLIELDPSEYELAVALLQANIEQALGANCRIGC